MATKPTLKPEWATGGGAAIVEPGGAKKSLGWIVEKPPHQFFNWLLNLYYLWINYFEEKTDDLQTGLNQEITDRGDADSLIAGDLATEITDRGDGDALLGMRILSIFDGIVGAASHCTDISLAAAIARLSAGARILVLDSAALATPIALSKSDMEIVLKPGVIISAGAATTGFTVTASGCKIHGGKISGFTNGVDVQLGGDRLMIRDIWFDSNTSDVNDPLDLASILGCI